MRFKVYTHVIVDRAYEVEAESKEQAMKRVLSGDSEAPMVEEEDRSTEVIDLVEEES